MVIMANITIEDFKQMSDAEKRKVKREVLVDLLLKSNDTSDLTSAIENLNDLLKTYKAEQEDNSKAIVAMKVELELIKEENCKIKDDYSSRLNQLEQRSRIKNIEIVGLRKPNELESDTSLSVKFLKEVVGADVDTSDIDACHEVPSRRHDKKRVVIVAFKFRCKKDEIMENRSSLRTHNKDLSLDHRVYVNEQLSPQNRRLYAMAAKRKKELGFKFLWTKKGIPLLRKDEHSNVFKILNDDDIAKVS